MTLRRRTCFFAVYCLAVAAGSAGILQRLVAFSRGDDSASHVILIPFISAALIFRNRASIFAAVSFDRVAGAAAILTAFCVTVAAARGGGMAEPGLTLHLAVAGVVGMWMGGFLFFFGAQAFRAAGFALLFMAFTIPLPAALLDGVTQVLKVGSTEAVAELFSLSGVPHHRQGFVFTLPTVAIEVADACSGIRSTIALTLTALLAGDVFLQSTWKKVLLVLAVFPITVVKNAIRIVSLSLLATYVNPSFLSGRLHTDGGVVFFLMALGLLAPVLAIFRRLDTPRAGIQRGAIASV
jgi:exosortase